VIIGSAISYWLYRPYWPKVLVLTIGNISAHNYFNCFTGNFSSLQLNFGF